MGPRTPEKEEQVVAAEATTQCAVQEEDPGKSHHCRELESEGKHSPRNYRRLGLTSRLNHATGGTEKSIKLLGLNDPSSSRADISANSTANKLNIVSRAPAPQATGTDEIEVERDPETGAILRVVGVEEPVDNPLDDPLNVFDEDEDAEEWNGFAMVPHDGGSENPVIRELERAARNGVRKAPRKQSQREAEWIERMVAKYGEDCAKMSRDRKLNPMQQTEADIRKRMQKWKATSGQQ